jgi:alpha-mannosidase
MQFMTPSKEQSARPYVIHVISNTHWDREWLYNFQETRMMLVEFFDRLLDVFEQHAGYCSYVLDSQVAPVEDYLEVRPENRDRLMRLVAEGKLLVGPWYTCPEGFEVNGESLVRNLLYGHRAARALGGVMKVGHTPFSYGQNSQMPQIYMGFGIDTMLFYHGVSHDEVKNEWIFEGADGTRILGSQMSSGARYNFYHQVYRPTVFGMTQEEREWAWNKGGLPFHPCAPEHALDHYALLDPVRGFDRERLAEQVKRLRDREIEVSTTRHLAFMMGHDSSIPDPIELELIAGAQEALPQDEVKHGRYPDLLDAIKSEVDWDRLAVLKGERRVPKPMPITMHLYSDVLSSRNRMKRLNARAEALLQRRAEPFAVCAALAGAEYPQGLLDLAWKQLLESHAHDSISGSGVDDIEQDMMYRLRQVVNLANGVKKQALRQLQLQIDNGTDPEAILLTVFNPSPWPRSEVVSACVDTPYTGPRGEFGLSDGVTGEAITVQGGQRRPFWAVVNHLADATHMLKTQRYDVHFEASEVPGLGYATYRVDRAKMFHGGSLVTAANTLENEHLRVQVGTDGALTITHKETGAIYEDLGYFVDNGEAGHAWMHHNPAFDEVIDSRGFPVRIALVEDGPLLARFRIDTTMRVPARLDENGGDPWQRLDGVGNAARRSEETRELCISTKVTLRRGGRSVQLDVRLDNTAADHRLRMMFPTRREGTTCHAESAFDVVERDTEFGPESPWHGVRGVTFPMQRFVDVSDGWAGLAVLNDGLREYEVTQDTDRAIAVTLLRAYEVNLTTVSCRWEKHPEMRLSQCPGEHEFQFRILPHAGDYAAGGVLAEAERFCAPLEPAQAGAHPGGLPPRHGFIEVSPPNLVLSACKRAEDGQGWILRLFNPTEDSIEGVIRFGQPIATAQLVTLEETALQPLNVDEGARLECSVGPKKIVTLKFSL